MTTTATKAIRFKVIKPVYETLTIHEPLPEYMQRHKRFNCAEDVYLMFRHLSTSPREVFIALHLDNKNRVLCIDQVSQGSLSASIVHPREVFTSAILSACAGLVFVHNHPSGDTTPSSEDISLTKRLRECADLLGIRVLDHVIIGENCYMSFSERGLI